MTEYRILEGDASDVLRTLPAASVQTVITSPPYWGLRDYGQPGQLGLEPTPEEYVERLVAIFREVRRVLRDDGTVWLNLGDSYFGTGRGPSNDHKAAGLHSNVTERGEFPLTTLYTHDTLKGKDLVGVPWRTAFALQADGWYLRSDIIWAKPNPMPESVTDRPTKAHEYVFLLAKSARYYFDADAVREDHTKPWTHENRGNYTNGTTTDYDIRTGTRERFSHAGLTQQDAGRNIRSVWNIATHPYPGAHFATFPPKLVEPCVRAGTSEKGCCSGCGASWVRQVEIDRPEPAAMRPKDPRTFLGHSPTSTINQSNWHDERTQRTSVQTTGWRSGCDHVAEPVPSTVLDPFAGAGTCGMVALREGRDFIGIELNPTYAQMARDRIWDDGPLFNVEASPHD